jgi:hypothetical protein
MNRRSLHRSGSRLFTLGLAAALAGCMVGPNFQPPAAPIASQTFAAPGDAPPPADQPLALGQPSPADWWRAFHGAPSMRRRWML